MEGNRGVERTQIVIPRRVQRRKPKLPVVQVRIHSGGMSYLPQHSSQVEAPLHSQYRSLPGIRHPSS